MPSFRKRDLKRVTVYLPQGPAEGRREWTGETYEIEAVIVPRGYMSQADQYTAQQWGRLDDDTMALYCCDGNGARLARGQGVRRCDEELPDCEITGVEEWLGYYRAFLQVIPVARR